MSEDRHDVLARITDDPQFARVVPLLQPEVLHAVIRHYGLHDCGELLALATPEQFADVFDLDLWKTDRAGADEQFDAARFCEWLEVLVDASPEIAGRRLAKMDAALIVAGLLPHVRVFDPAVFSPEVEPTGADAVSNAGRERGVHLELGGYIVVARKVDAWDAIVQSLLALDEHEPETFHRVMQGCRRLSDSAPEIDGLDNLVPEAEQQHLDLSQGREQRRDRLGFLAPQQARAFLDSARHVSLTMDPPQGDLLFAAYLRSPTTMNESEMRSVTESAGAGGEHPGDTESAVAGLSAVLQRAGVVADRPRALLPAALDEASSVHAALNQFLQRSAASGDAAWVARNQELAFLGNALLAGCSVLGRPFTRREAVDAVAATCNLGLEYWPTQWRASSNHDLVTVFQVGWTVLHREVTMMGAGQLLGALDNLQPIDRDLQLELYEFRRELQKQRHAGTPWQVRDRLDVLAALDLPAWAALTALFDQYPVMLANVAPPGNRRPHTVNLSDFRFIANAQHIRAIREFLLSLAELLAG
jgi:hypothetical protein